MSDGEGSFRTKYSFTQEESDELSNLFSMLQKEISSRDNFPDKTRIKLLEKLEEIILYFEPEVGKLDVFWSFIGRAEIAFKVYTKDAVPESLKEFAKVIWKVQCREEGRPPDSKPPIIF